MGIAVCPGSFDPVTRGHIALFERAARLFDRLLVTVMVNPDKKAGFTIAERAEMLRIATAHIPNVQVDTYTGLVADYARQRGVHTVVRGLRTTADAEYEFQMAEVNRRLNPLLDTLFLQSAPGQSAVSSSAVKVLARAGADLTDYVPAALLERVAERFRRPERPERYARTGQDIRPSRRSAR